MQVGDDERGQEAEKWMTLYKNVIGKCNNTVEVREDRSVTKIY